MRSKPAILSLQLIDARLDFMTYEMPAHIIVLPYRGGSSTTAATAAESAR